MRVFLDANVLFSAAYREHSGLLDLWSLPNIVLVASPSVVDEVRRNLGKEGEPAMRRLDDLLGHIEISLMTRSCAGHGLPKKDVHVLESALGSSCAFLVTGDRTHFGHLYGKSIGTLEVVTPRQLLLAFES